MYFAVGLSNISPTCTWPFRGSILNICNILLISMCVTLFGCSLAKWLKKYRAVAARDLLLRNVSGGVQEMQSACRRNGLFALFQYANMLSFAQRRRYMTIAELIGNVDHLLLFRNGGWRFFSYLLWPSNPKSTWYYVLASWFNKPVSLQRNNSRNTSFIGLQPVHKWTYGRKSYVPGVVMKVGINGK